MVRPLPEKDLPICTEQIPAEMTPGQKENEFLFYLLFSSHNASDSPERVRLLSQTDVRWTLFRFLKDFNLVPKSYKET